MDEKTNMNLEEKQNAPEVHKTNVGKGREQENLRMFIMGFIGLILIALVVSSGVGIYRTYALGATDSFTVGIARVLNLPLMKVNGERILYSDYVKYLKAVETSVAYDKQTGGQNGNLSHDDITDRVLWWQVDNVLTKQTAKTYSVTVEDKDMEAPHAQLMQQFQTVDAANKEIEKRYGWDLATYEDRIMRNLVLQNKLNDKISADQASREEVRKRAQAVLDELKKGASFEEMAKQHGEDGTAANGGSLGWFKKGDMVPQFETAAFALKKGAMTQTLVETEYGYHIIKLDDRKTEKVKDSKGKMVNEESVNARHILFRFPSIDTVLNDMTKKADIHLYAKIHDPFTTLNKQ